MTLQMAIPSGSPVGRQPVRTPMLIGGEWVGAVDGGWRDITAPARHGVVLARVPDAGAADVDLAVAAARHAFPGWRDRHFKDRQRLLLAVADAVEACAEDLARSTAADTGNAIRTQARPEVATLVDLFRYFGGVAGEVKGVTLPAGAGQLQYTRQEPLGVVGGILPWNSPLMIAGFKVPAALAAGNTVVLKAAEDAPLSVLMLAEICDRILPPGVLNVITGDGRTAGAALVEHPDVDKISFTGSTGVGRSIAASAGGRLVHVSLELGGKNPSIVFPGEITDELIEGLLLSTRVHRQGQSCTAGSRLFLHRDIRDEVLERLASRMESLVVGDPLDEASDIGAIIVPTRDATATPAPRPRGLPAQPTVRVVPDSVVEVDRLPTADEPSARGMRHGRFHQFQQHAAGVPGMHEVDPGAGGSASRGVVEQPEAAGPEPGARLVDVGDPQRQLLQARPALADERRDGRRRGQRRQQLDLRAAVAEGDHGFVDALLGVLLAVRESAAQHVGVEGDGGIQVRHGDPHVIDHGVGQPEGGGGPGHGWSISQSTVPAVTTAPSAGTRPRTTPPRWAFTGCSIFIASRTRTRSPTSTVSPSETATFTMVPCMGATSAPAVAAGPDVAPAVRRFAVGRPPGGAAPTDSDPGSVTVSRRPSTSTTRLCRGAVSAASTGVATKAGIRLSNSSSIHRV